MCTCQKGKRVNEADRRAQQRAETQIARNMLTDESKSIYIALEEVDIDWFWDIEDVLELDQMYKAGKSIQEMCEWFGRTGEEVALLIMDRAMQNKIRARAI